MIEAKIDASNFLKWAFHSIRRVHNVSQTFNKISAIVEVHTRKFVPLDQGYLIDSFDVKETFKEYPIMGMVFEWSGRENPEADGFDYAHYQNVTFLNHPKRGYTGVSHFVERGIGDSLDNIIVELEADYLTSLGVGR